MWQRGAISIYLYLPRVFPRSRRAPETAGQGGPSWDAAIAEVVGDVARGEAPLRADPVRDEAALGDAAAEGLFADL